MTSAASQPARSAGMSMLVAVTLRPDVVLWSEAAVPWTIDGDDDLLGTVLAITRLSGAFHILGAMTIAGAQSSGAMFNSVLTVLADGTVISRYNKCRLMLGVETPLRIPFSKPVMLHPARENLVEGTMGLMASPKGAIGAIVCNENLY